MVKVYVNYAKLKKEKEPRLSVSTRKSYAEAFKLDYEEVEERRPGSVTANKIRTVDF